MSSQQLSPQEMIELSREIQSLMAAGVPLGSGLLAGRGQFSSRLDECITRVAGRLEQGATIEAAMESEAELPPFFRAAFVAGAECGQADEVLDDLCNFGEMLLSFRDSLRRGLVYPFFVGALVLVICTVIMPNAVNQQLLTLQDINVEPSALVSWLSYFVQTLESIGPWVLGAAILAAFFITLKAIFAPSVLLRSLSWIPGTERLLRDIELSRVTHLLGILLRYEVPMPQALRFAAASSSSTLTERSFLRIAERTEQGESFHTAVSSRNGFPPFLAWLLSSQNQGTPLPHVLISSAEYYRKQAEHRAVFIQRFIPTVLMLVFAAGITLLYGLLVMIPVSELMRSMALP